jgi:nicotinamidase/pyrazinamidase
MAALQQTRVQGCFLPNGALPTQPTAGTLALVRTINTLRTAGRFDLVVFTQEWHPPNHISFAAVHSKQPLDKVELHYTSRGELCSQPGSLQRLYPTQCVDCSCNNNTGNSGTTLQYAGTAGLPGSHYYQQQQQQQQPKHNVEQVLWPDHCLQHSIEARLHPGLIIKPDDIVLRKGWQPQLDAYSAFQDNGRVKNTGLAALLKHSGIRSVVVAGVALEYCVMYTALDAVQEEFETSVVLAATAPVDAAGAEEAVQQLQQANVSVVERVWDLVPADSARSASLLTVK